MNLPTRLQADLTQRGQENLAVGVVVEDRFAPVPTIHNVVDSARVLNPKFARHTVRKNPFRQSRCQATIDE